MKRYRVKSESYADSRKDGLGAALDSTNDNSIMISQEGY
jgi:hypothetical protein